MHRPRYAGVAVALVATTLTASPSAGQTDTVSIVKKIAGLSLVWQEANYNFAHFRLVPDLDWNAAFEEAIARVMGTYTDYAYVRELQRFAALLGEAHTNVAPGREFRDAHGGHPAVELEEMDRQAVIVNTSRDLASVLPLGSVVVAVDGTPVDEYLATRVFPYQSASTEQYLWRSSIRGHRWQSVGLLIGDVGSTVTITIQAADGGRRDVDLERLGTQGTVEWQQPRRGSEPILEFRRLDNEIVYFALNTFNDPEVVTEFEKHLEELQTARAVVLDVRNNGGGNSSHGWNIGKYFSDVPLEASHWRTPEHRASHKAWGRRSSNPQTQLYYKMDAWYTPDEFSKIDPPDRTFVVPVAILFGPSTYSAAEDFLSFMRAVPHAVYVGSASAGSTGQPLVFPVAAGAWAGITTKHDTMPDGTEFVGYGVTPDVEVRQTVDAYRAGRDLVLERALEVLAVQLR